MNEELEALAGEYVLGTLPPGERAEFGERMLRDPEARRAVRAWEERLAPLAASAAEVAPPPGLWHRIEAALAGGAVHVPDRSGEVVSLRRRVAAWRSAAMGAAAIAAAALVWIAVAPSALEPEGGTGRYVAVVDAGGREPALIAEVDTRTGVIRVRSLGAETPAGHSLELWHIAEGHEPRSLGILVAGTAPQRIQDQAGPVAGQIAVTVEPAGGSASGKPTGPVVYSGRLVPMDD